MRVYLTVAMLVLHLLAFSYCSAIRQAPAVPSLGPYVAPVVDPPEPEPDYQYQALWPEADQAPKQEHQQRPYRVERMRVRAYTPWDDIDRHSPYRDGLTATLKDTREFPNQWGVAVCPSHIPYGTKLVIPGYNPSRHFPSDHKWEADDTGAIIRRHVRQWRNQQRDLPLIEVRFIHQRSARRWGTQVLDVRVYQ